MSKLKMRHFQTMCFRAKNGKQFLSDFKKEFGTFYIIFCNFWPFVVRKYNQCFDVSVLLRQAKSS